MSPAQAETQFMRGMMAQKQRTTPVATAYWPSRYYALVIGVSDYDPNQTGLSYLPYSRQDAKEVALMLRQMGMEVTLVSDPDSTEMEKALIDFTVNYGQEKDSAVLFYFAGHGETIDNLVGQHGYIFPKDAPTKKTNHAAFLDKAISLQRIQKWSEDLMSRHVLMLFDACFSGSIFTATRSEIEPFIANKISRPARQVITAGNDKERVPDRSIFKTVLIQGLQYGDADLDKNNVVSGMELGYYLQRQVINYSNNKQHPQYGYLNAPEVDKGDFVFRLPESEINNLSGRLSVFTDVAHAEIKLLNTSTLFHQGMHLAKGNYQLEVSAPGLAAVKHSISINDREHEKPVVLLKWQWQDKKAEYKTKSNEEYPEWLTSDKTKAKKAKATIDKNIAISSKLQSSLDSFFNEIKEHLSEIKTPDGKNLSDFNVTADNININQRLIGLILQTESMDNDNRQYWFEILLSMNSQQKSKLDDILTTEIQKLLILEEKYRKEIRNINNGNSVPQYKLDYANEMLKIQPESAYAYNQRALAWTQLDQRDKAMADYDTALVLDPYRAETYNSKAWTLATSLYNNVRDGRAAIKLAEKAIALDDQPDIQDTLAAAYAETGDYHQAKLIQETAIKELKKQGKSNREYEQHLKSFKKNRPWRE